MLDLRTTFIFCGKVENGWIKGREFRLRESFELCRDMGKNLFVVEGYLIDEERKEGEGRTREQVGLGDTFGEKITGRGMIRVTTQTRS